jgi:hypothetical protein
VFQFDIGHLMRQDKSQLRFTIEQDIKPVEM